MRASLGAGWTIWHLSDRCVELRKDDPVYRRFTDRDGYVLVRAEPGMDRHTMINRAVALANKQDEALALRVARQLIPRGVALEQYRAQQRRLAKGFGTPEDPQVRRYKP